MQHAEGTRDIDVFGAPLQSQAQSPIDPCQQHLLADWSRGLIAHR
jgi:hypothetical protein